MWAAMALIVAGVLLAPANGSTLTRHVNLASVPGIGGVIRYAASSAWLLRTLKLVFLAVFLLIVAAGLPVYALLRRRQQL